MKYGFIGAGQMGSAILSGILRNRLAKPADVKVFDKSAERCAELRKSLKVGVAGSLNDLVGGSDVVLLAVKPQNLGEVLAEIDPALAKKPLFVSIIAGRKIAEYERSMPGCRIVRVMPNLAMRVGEGMSAFCGGTLARKGDLKIAERILKCSGDAVRMEEPMFDAVTALSGSGPAFFAVLAQAFVDGAVKLGMRQEDALRLTLQTMLGTAKVLKEGDSPLREFVVAVTSKRGTTEAGLKVLEPSSAKGVIARTLRAAARRSAELGK